MNGKLISSGDNTDEGEIISKYIQGFSCHGVSYVWGGTDYYFTNAHGDVTNTVNNLTARCPMLKGKKRKIMHRYVAILDNSLHPCSVCKPKTDIEDWYMAQVLRHRKQLEAANRK